jgi:predicted O-methyltransferase YrrM
MSEEFVIDTTQNIIRSNQNDNADPFHNLPAGEWVQKQVDWRNKSQPSGFGLETVFNEHFGDKKIVGAEIGVCLAASTEHFMKNVPNIVKYFAIDSYPAYTDWNGADFNEERQSLMKQYALDVLQPYKDKIEFVYEDSIAFSQSVEDESLDFIFIDGDHSYEGFLKDLQAYFSKVKIGGIVSGDDVSIVAIRDGLQEFFKDKNVEIKTNNKMWYLVKE